MLYESLRHGTADFPMGIYDTHKEEGLWLYPHIHREFEFLVLCEGRGIMQVEDCSYELEAGDGVFINSRALHQGIQLDNKPADFYAIVFSPEIFGSLENDLIVNKYVLPVIDENLRIPVLFQKNEGWQSQVLELMDEIHVAFHKACQGWEIDLKARLFEIWRLCFEHAVPGIQSSHGRSSNDIKLALEYIRHEFASIVTLENMAASAGMSKGHFCRVFSSHMRMSPFDYLLRVRIGNGCNYLRETELPIGEIAQCCGFNSFSYFSKRFKEIMGCTPLEYRSRFRVTAPKGQ